MTTRYQVAFLLASAPSFEMHPLINVKHRTHPEKDGEIL